ncbi:MAG: hypothetical protein JO001_10555 [Alphaproteobacteria bacterium]|nr:hypothetical protein [Alphaproteobacteria bacterium]
MATINIRMVAAFLDPTGATIVEEAAAALANRTNEESDGIPTSSGRRMREPRWALAAAMELPPFSQLARQGDLSVSTYTYQRLTGFNGLFSRIANCGRFAEWETKCTILRNHM